MNTDVKVFAHVTIFAGPSLGAVIAAAGTAGKLYGIGFGLVAFLALFFLWLGLTCWLALQTWDRETTDEFAGKKYADLRAELKATREGLAAATEKLRAARNPVPPPADIRSRII